MQTNKQKKLRKLQQNLRTQLLVINQNKLTEFLIIVTKIRYHRQIPCGGNLSRQK